MFDAKGAEQVSWVTSDPCRLEPRVLQLREGDQRLLNRYDAFFSTLHAYASPMSSGVFDLATQIRAEHRLKTPDAPHLASASHSGCDEFWTLDDRLNRAAQHRLNVINLTDSIQ
jgi:predicted nucleic acid-binding protein